MLIQLPVLFAFYRLLGAAVELRGASWFFGSTVCRPPTLLRLPLIIGPTQSLQQRMTPTASDPMQRRISSSCRCP